MTTSISGTVYGDIELPPKGSEADLPDEVAQELCTQGYAYPVNEMRAAETATKAEQTEKRSTRASQ